MNLGVEYCATRNDQLTKAWRIAFLDELPGYGPRCVVNCDEPPWLTFARQRDAEIAARVLSSLSFEEFLAMPDTELRRRAYEHLQW